MKAVLGTSRLTLRELESGDLGYIMQLLGDKEVMRFWERTYSRAESREWIERQQDRYQRDGHGFWLAVETASGEPVGQAGVLRQTVKDREELGLGYIIAKPHWRRGLATEAAQACLQFIRSELRSTRAISLIRPENAASVGVALKLGMAEEDRVQYYGFEHIVFVKRMP